MITQQEYKAVVARRLELCRAKLEEKRAEYTLGKPDPLHNFRRQAEMQRQTMAQTAWNLVSKQIVSIMDMIETDGVFPGAVWDEKLGDIINYCILIDAITRESCARSEGMEGLIPMEMEHHVHTTR